MKWRRMLMLGAALGTMALGQPESALARDCEDICADLAAKNCQRINSVGCGFYIGGCLAGCSVGKILVLLTGD